MVIPRDFGLPQVPQIRYLNHGTMVPMLWDKNSFALRLLRKHLCLMLPKKTWDLDGFGSCSNTSYGLWVDFAGSLETSNSRRYASVDVVSVGNLQASGRCSSYKALQSLFWAVATPLAYCRMKKHPIGFRLAKTGKWAPRPFDSAATLVSLRFQVIKHSREVCSEGVNVANICRNANIHVLSIDF